MIFGYKLFEFFIYEICVSWFQNNCTIDLDFGYLYVKFLKLDVFCDNLGY